MVQLRGLSKNLSYMTQFACSPQQVKSNDDQKIIELKQRYAEPVSFQPSIEISNFTALN
jgi:hypothetical protein